MFAANVFRLIIKSGCSLKEATVVASVLSKVSVPVLHSAAALMRLAGMDYSGEFSALWMKSTHICLTIAHRCFVLVFSVLRTQLSVYPSSFG